MGEELPDVEPRVLDTEETKLPVLTDDEQAAFKTARTTALEESKTQIQAIALERVRNKTNKLERVKALRARMKNTDINLVDERIRVWQLRSNVAEQLQKEEAERQAKLEELIKAAIPDKKKKGKKKK